MLSLLLRLLNIEINREGAQGSQGPKHLHFRVLCVLLRLKKQHSIRDI
jgi:hypothetical protein